MKGHSKAIVEDFFEILEQVHNKDCLHAGSKKTKPGYVNSVYRRYEF